MIDFSKILMCGVISTLCLYCDTLFAQKCPNYSVGAYEIKDKNGSQLFISTARANFEDDDSINIAIDSAKILAKDNLQKLENFPKEKDGKLTGVLDISHCIKANSAFATVKYSITSSRASKRLRDIMDESLRAYPSPSSN